MRISLPLLLLFFVLPALSNAQDPVYSVEQVRNDFKLFRKALEESHPGLYRYRSKQEMDQRFDGAYTTVAAPMTELELFKKMTPIISALGCGHTSVRLSEQYQANHDLQLLLPFEFRFIDGKAIVTKTHIADSDLAPGSELVAIDGVPIQTIATTLLPYLNGDGFITTSRYKAMEQFFSRLLRVYIRENDSYQITLKTRSGKGVTKSVKLIPPASIKQPVPKPTLEYSLLSDQAAVLTVRSFGSNVTHQAGVSYEDFLARSFGDLRERKIKNLIIDLRGNGGGRDDYGALLFSYLTTKSFMYYSYLEMKAPTLSFLKFTGKPESFRAELESRVTRTADGRYLYKKMAHPCLPLQPPQLLHFNSDVYVLIDGRSFSATSEFASIASFKKRAVFVGEETGGAYEGNTSGGGVELILPETKIKVIIPLTKYACAVEPDHKPKGRGIIPDIEVKPNVADVLSGKDTAMEKVIELISINK